MDLMAVRKGETMPLYMHVVNRVLRDLRLRQQQTGAPFDYQAFKKLLAREDLTESQRVPLAQRLDTLESFMAPRAEAVPQQQQQQQKKKMKAAPAKPAGNEWAPRAGQLTIVDLSDPFVMKTHRSSYLFQHAASHRTHVERESNEKKKSLLTYP